MRIILNHFQTFTKEIQISQQFSALCIDLNFVRQQYSLDHILMHTCVFVDALLVFLAAFQCQGIDFVALNRETIYEYEGSVDVIAQAPWDQKHLKSTQTAGWKIRGTVKLQRSHDTTLAASVRQNPIISYLKLSSSEICQAVIIIQISMELLLKCLHSALSSCLIDYVCDIAAHAHYCVHNRVAAKKL